MNIFPEAKIHNISRSLASFLLSACCVLGLAGCVTTPYVVGNATSKFTTEADIVRTLGYQAAGSDVQGFPSVFPRKRSMSGSIGMSMNPLLLIRHLTLTTPIGLTRFWKKNSFGSWKKCCRRMG